MYIPSGSGLINPTFLFGKTNIREGWNVADLGCGSGYFVFPAARMVGADARVYAVDILKSALSSVESRARFENLKNIKTVWSNLEMYGATKINEGSLDLALLINNRAKEPMIRESVRLIKSGGRLLIADWKLTHTPFGPSPEKRVGPNDTKAMAKNCGLELVEEFDAGKYHWGLLFKKL